MYCGGTFRYFNVTSGVRVNVLNESEQDSRRSIGYAVYFEVENGFLIFASPSFWSWDPASAIRYSTPEKAWIAAKRRGAIAVELYQRADGSLDYEALESPGKPKPGSWIIVVHLERYHYPHFVVSAGAKRMKLVTTEEEAKGYARQSTAERVAQGIRAQSKGAIKAVIRQVTAEILEFPGQDG